MAKCETCRRKLINSVEKAIGLCQRCEVKRYIPGDTVEAHAAAAALYVALAPGTRSRNTRNNATGQ